MKKKALLVSVFLFLILGGSAAFFARPLFLKGAQWKLNQLCKKSLGESLSYTSFAWDEGKIILSEGRAGDLSIEKVVFRPHFSWRERKIGGDLLLEGLTYSHVKRQRAAPFEPDALTTDELPFFSLHLNTEVKEGQLLLYDASEETTTFRHVGFEGKHLVSGKRAEGEWQIYLDEEVPTCVGRYVSPTDGEAKLTASLHSPHFSKVLDLVHYAFDPSPNTDWAASEGSVEGTVRLTFHVGRLASIAAELTALDVEATNPSLSIEGGVEKISAMLDLDLTSREAVNSWNGAFRLYGGHVCLPEKHHEFWQGMWELSDVGVEVVVNEGQVEKSKLDAHFMGMQGEFDLDWNSPDELMHVVFSGEVEEILPFTPGAVQRRYKESLAGNRVGIDAVVRRKRQGIELEGNLEIVEEGGESDMLAFGCHFGRDLAVQPLPPTLPDVFVEKLKDQFFLSGRRLGWLKGNDFRLEKYLAPILAREFELELTGRVDFDATFDEKFLIFFYEGRDFHLEGTTYAIDVEKVERRATPSIEMVAAHYINLDNWEHVGFLPLKKARYRQKKFDLDFTEGDGLVYFENRSIGIKNVSAQWNDLAVKGEVDVLIGSAERVETKLRTHSIQGPAAQTQDFLSHFTPSLFWELPLAGSVTSGEKDVDFHFIFFPKEERTEVVSGRARGELVADFRGAEWLAERMGTYPITFDYDFSNHGVQFFDAEGCLIGKTDVSEEGRTFEVNTRGIEQEEKGFFALKGGQRGETFAIDDFSYGRFHGSGVLTMGEPLWDVEKFEMRLDDLAHFNFVGKWNHQLWELTCSLSDFRVDLSALPRVTDLPAGAKKWLSIWQPDGKITGDGELRWKFHGSELSADASASFYGLEFGGIHFGDGEDLICSLTSDEGLSVEGLEVELPEGEERIHYKLGKLHYTPKEQRIAFDGFDFSLPPEKISQVRDLSERLFPGKVHSSVFECVEALKVDEPLAGRVSFSSSPETLWVHLTLKDGIYHVGGAPLDLHNTTLSYDPDALKLWTQTRFQGFDYNVHVATDSRVMRKGQVFVNDQPFSSNLPSLVGEWERGEDNQFHLYSLHGPLCGLHANLEEKGEGVLTGRIDIDALQASKLLIPELQALVFKGNLGKGYALEGDFTLPLFNDNDFSFNGTLMGNRFVMGGIEFGSLRSDLYLSADQISLRNFAIHDWAGNLVAHEATFRKWDGEWLVTVPYLQLSDMRLSRLKRSWGSSGEKQRKAFLKSLYIKSFEVNNLSGLLGDRNTFTGFGDLQFTNLPRKTLFSNLLLLPTDMIARIGLDLTLLIPVRGTICFELNDGRFDLVKFQDVYSDGKRSRFYLAKEGPSYVDFGGNLNLNVRMKQYNLLMKIAELLTVTVRGTVLKPSYTFTNNLNTTEDVSSNDA